MTSTLDLLAELPTSPNTPVMNIWKANVDNIPIALSLYSDKSGLKSKICYSAGISLWIVSFFWFFFLPVVYNRPILLTIWISISVISLFYPARRKPIIADWFFDNCTKHFKRWSLVFEDSTFKFHPEIVPRLNDLVKRLENKRPMSLGYEPKYSEDVTKSVNDYKIISPKEVDSSMHETLSNLNPNNEISAKKPILYVLHSHGIYCVTWGTLMMSGLFSDVLFCFADVLDKNKIFNFYNGSMGTTTSVRKDLLEKRFREGKNLCLLPGGFEESTIHNYGEHLVFLEKRKGFIKLALKYGYRVVPVYSFGEPYTYTNNQWNIPYRLKMNSKGLPAVMPWGLSWLPVCCRNEIDTYRVVVGSGIELPKIDNPSFDDVQKYHDLYVQELKSLFRRHIKRTGNVQDAAVEDLKVM